MDLSLLDISGHKLIQHFDEVIKWRNGDYFPPLYVEVNPTDRCNQRCWFCGYDYLGHESKDITPQKLIETFISMGKAGVKAVLIQGTGEPLCNKGVPDAIVAGKEAGLGVSLSTNGVLLNRPMLEKILPYLSWLLIGQVELNPELYAKSHGCNEKHWHTVIENLKTAVEIRNRLNLPETVISTHVMPFPYNYDSLFETARMIKELGVDYINIKPAVQKVRNENIGHWPKDAHKICAEQLAKAKAEFEERDFKVHVKLHEFEHAEKAGTAFRNYNRCYGVEFETALDCDGGLYPCSELWRNKDYCYGNINEQSFGEIWKSARKKKVLEKYYNEFDINTCPNGGSCKQGKINQILWNIKNPPMHKEFI